MSEKQVVVRVKRQAAPKQESHWEEFVLRWRPAMNVNAHPSSPSGGR